MTGAVSSTDASGADYNLRILWPLAATTFLNQNVFAANAFEAAQQRDPSRQKLADETVAYVGPALRASPRSRETSTKG